MHTVELSSPHADNAMAGRAQTSRDSCSRGVATTRTRGGPVSLGKYAHLSPNTLSSCSAAHGGTKLDMFLTQRWDTLGPQDSRASCVGSGVDQPFVWDTHTLSASAHHISSRRARTHRFSLGNARRGRYKHDAHWQHHLLGTFQFTEPSTYSITPLTSRRVHGGTEHDKFLQRSGGKLFGTHLQSRPNFPGKTSQRPRSRTPWPASWSRQNVRTRYNRDPIFQTSSRHSHERPLSKNRFGLLMLCVVLLV